MTWMQAVTTPVIVASGAGQGYPVERWRGYWPDAAYHLFEVSPESLALLWQKYGGDARVTINRDALSDSYAPMDFYFNAVEMASGFYPFNRDSHAFFPQWGFETKGKVRCTTLDGYCLKRGIDRIGLWELDVQGGELKALHGAARLLSAQAIDALMVEVFYTELYKGVPMAADVIDYLDGMGYQAVESSGECSHIQDVVFTRGAK